MNTLRQFSEKNYFAYQARQDYIRQQNSIRFDYERELQQERLEKISNFYFAYILRNNSAVS
jgi:hypothetical protein